MGSLLWILQSKVGKVGVKVEWELQHNYISFFVQFHLHLQLSEVAEYARNNKVVLKGDLPVGVDRHSVDTWVYPSLFRMNTWIGSPPYYFNKNWQNWGFPTYNWEEMSKDNNAWWQSRLAQMGKYFTAYRIYHILGLTKSALSYAWGIWGMIHSKILGSVSKNVGSKTNLFCF